MSKKNVHVEIISFEELTKYHIKIPDFQRSYVWKISNLQKLVDDFTEFLNSTQCIYYMGTVLLYKNGNYSEVIDGQQRLTTLSILYYAINKNIPTSFELEFSSEDSIHNIINAKKFFSQIKSFDDTLFSKLQFTIISTTSQDEAFTFFDTQNSRGVKLKSIDLLKAHHLRAVNGDDKQEFVARKWEKIETNKKGFIREKNDFIDELFKYILYRSRVWKGNHSRVVMIEKNRRIASEKIKDEFEKGEVSKKIHLYPHYKNMLASTIQIEDGEYVFNCQWQQKKQQTKDIPFSLRQPISKGIEFFIYVEKYAQIVDFLQGDNVEVEDFKLFYNSVLKSISLYFQEFFMLCMVSYYDKFEHHQLFEFALWLEYFIGLERLESSRIVEQTVPKLIREMDYNIVDEIFNAYTPNQIINYLKSLKINYTDKDYGGVQKKYVDAVKKYYDKTKEDTIKNKRKWIEEKIENVK